MHYLCTPYLDYIPVHDPVDSWLQHARLHDYSLPPAPLGYSCHYMYYRQSGLSEVRLAMFINSVGGA